VSRKAPARKRRSLSVLALLVAFAVIAPPASASLQTQLSRALRVPGVSPSLTGALVIRLDSGRVVYSRNANLSLRPASTEKLTVALAALDRLGPHFRIETTVLGEGRLIGRVWKGRLVLKGYGDPTLQRADLARLARRVRDAGVSRVTGAIVGDESYFDSRRTAPGWKASFYKLESPPLSALVINRARLGRRVVDDPALSAAVLFRRELRVRGIRVPGRAVRGVAGVSAVEIARTVSPRVAVLVRSMNRVSDNFIAEMLMKQLGARRRGAGTTSAGARVVRYVLRRRGVPLLGVRIVDGSGLSAYDRLTAKAVVALLISAWSDRDIARYFVMSLPVAGISGTLEDRMTAPPARGNVYAKTGTTNEGSALSGYVRRRYAFAVVMNGHPIPWWNARRGQDRFATRLAAN
jgi:D-alanyl-D-alanine carboxypeptidase/D-alanyl-D-alanine-endopeptidase (penicillin-binding protein 4)